MRLALTAAAAADGLYSKPDSWRLLEWRQTPCRRDACWSLTTVKVRRCVCVRVDRRELVAIFAGGSIGTVTRVLVADALPSAVGHWPWATFSVNLAGAFLAGYFTTRLQERVPLSAYQRPLLGTGFCGALTTFSTMQVELLRMLDAGDWGLAAGYASASLVG